MTADTGQTCTKIPIANNSLNNDTRTIADSREVDTTTKLATLRDEIGDQRRVVSVCEEFVHPSKVTRLLKDPQQPRTTFSKAVRPSEDNSGTTLGFQGLTVPLAN